MITKNKRQTQINRTSFLLSKILIRCKSLFYNDMGN